MVAESEVGIRAVRDANEALVSLDLAESTPREPLNTGLEVGP
jgi:hypothetical protein